MDAPVVPADTSAEVFISTDTSAEVSTFTDTSAEVSTFTDTSAEVSRKMVLRWRSMSPDQKGELVEAMCADVDEIARLGIRRTEPDVSVEREKWLMMVRRYGRNAARAVLGDEPPRAVS
jgi:hypothetical protein